jgi:hypothetical protein
MKLFWPATDHIEKRKGKTQDIPSSNKKEMRGPGQGQSSE